MLLEKCRRILAIVLATSVLAANAAYANDVQESNSISVVACADTYVEGGTNKSNVNGNSDVLLSKRQSNDTVLRNKNDKASYIKFDLAGISDLSVDEIGKIAIMLTNADSVASEASVYATEWTVWSEDTLTAENVEYAEYGDIESNYNHIADIDIAAGETLSINVTEYVRNLIRNQKTAFTLVIIGESDSSITSRKLLKIASRETSQASDKPTLVISKRAFEPITDEDAVDDGYVSISDPTANFAQENMLLTGNGYTSFFKFNLQEFDVAKLKSAKLSLFAGSEGVTSVTAMVYVTDNNWSSNMLSYENMPVKGNPCGEIVLNDGQRCEIDVLAAVAAAKSRGSNSVSFAMEADNVIGIASTHSGTNRPKLSIDIEEVTQAPERENVSLKFSKEAYVRPDTQKDVNFGGELKVKQEMRQAIIEIDLSQLSDLGFSKAMLSIYTSDLEPGYSGAANTDVYAISSDWEQDTITYNNMPEIGDFLGSFEMKLDTWSKLDITDYVKEELTNGNQRVSVILLQTDRKMNMTISSSNSEENPSALNIYYPLTDEDMSWLADGKTNNWHLSKATQSNGVFALSGDGAKAISPNYTRNVIGNWNDNKFLVKASIKTANASGAELALAKGKEAYARLIRTEATDDGVKIYTNTSDDGVTKPQNVFSKVFGKDEKIIFVAVIENEKISYYINGQAAGTTTLATGLTSEADSIGLFCSAGTVEFSNVEMFGYDADGGNREFDVKGDRVITIDSLDSVKIPFTTEITTTEFIGKVSINGEVVNGDRLSVGEDGKTLIIAPSRNGYEAHSDNFLNINAQSVCDVFGEYATSKVINRAISVTGWDCSAWVTQAERTQGLAEVSVKINNTTSATKNISILLVRVSGNEDEYMFEEKIIEDVVVSGNSVIEIGNLLLNTVSEDGFMKVFVYDSSTYEPMLRVPYTF